MNKTSTGWGTRLVLAVAFVGVATASLPALADAGLPPAKYDIGGATTAITRARFFERFGDEIELIQVPVDLVGTECNAVHLRIWGEPYPASETAGGGRLLGCVVGRTLVYPLDLLRPRLANRILRHEIGHLLGWPDNHERD